MKRLIRWTAVLVLLLSGAVGAQTQNLVGQWQGTLGGQLRLVFIFAATGQGNTLGVTLYSIDQTPAGIAVTPTIQGGSVRLFIAPINGGFEGKLSADGNSKIGRAHV